MSKHYRPTNVNKIAMIYVAVRERLCDGDNPHPMRKFMTVEQAEKYTKDADTLYRG